jgi:hypothetical protein
MMRIGLRHRARSRSRDEDRRYAAREQRAFSPVLRDMTEHPASPIPRQVFSCSWRSTETATLVTSRRRLYQCGETRKRRWILFPEMLVASAGAPNSVSRQHRAGISLLGQLVNSLHDCGPARSRGLDHPADSAEADCIRFRCRP